MNACVCCNYRETPCTCTSNFTSNTKSINTDGVPHDGVPIEKTVTVHVSMTVIFSAASAIGIIFAIACVLFNFVQRNKQ